MPNILEKPEAGALSGSESMYGVQSGSDVRITPALLKAYIGATVTANIADGNKGDITVTANGATWKLNNFTPFGKALSSSIDAAAAKNLLGLGGGAGGTQPYSSNLNAIAELISAANTLPYFTGSGTASLAPITAFARSLLDDADAATARSTLGISSSTGGLANFDEAAFSTTPNSPVGAVRLQVKGTQTSIDLVLSPKDTGAISRHLADGATTGGNKRGPAAVDLQHMRSAANQVASGQSSFVAGEYNTASNITSAAFGSNNTASGPYCFATGTDNVVSGDRAAALAGNANTVNSNNAITLGGKNLSTRGIHGLVAFGNSGPTTGRRQGEFLNFSANTTNEFAVDLAAVFVSAEASNQFTLNNNSVEALRGLICAIDISTKDVKTWEFTATVKRITGAGSTTLVGTPNLNVIAQDTNAASWSVSLQADTTYGGFKIRVTGQSGKNVYWTAAVMGCYLEA